MSKAKPAQQGGTQTPAPQQQGQTATTPLQQNGTIFRDWASI